MKIISIFNQKGGVGKTTAVVNLSACLSKLGKKVLVIDFDPQANTTTGLGLDKNKLKKSIYDLFYIEDEENEPKISDYMEKNDEGIYLIGANSSLSGLEVELVDLEEDQRLVQLKNIIELVRDDFDLVLIDCPPSLGLLSVNALVASDSIIIPIQTEYYALEGVSQLLNTYELVKKSLNKNLQIEAVLLSMFDKNTGLSYEVAEEVKAYFKDKVFKSMIPRNIDLAEAPSFGKSSLAYNKDSKGAKAYLRLAKEVLEKLDDFEKEKKSLKEKENKEVKKEDEKEEIKEEKGANDE